MSENQTWYVIARSYGRTPYPEIKPMNVVKETDKTLTILENRSWGNEVTVTERRIYKDRNMFRTKSEAEAEISKRLSDDVKRAQDALREAKAAYEKWFVRP